MVLARDAPDLQNPKIHPESPPLMLSSEQIQEFDRFGVLRIPGLIARADAEAMCARVWKALEHSCGTRRHDPRTWNAERVTGMHPLRKSEKFEEIGNPAVREILDQMLGRGNWQAPDRWASLLVAFPNSREPWELPHQTWHLDYPVSPEMRGLFALRIFTVLAPLQAQGGGTLIAAGSPRLFDRIAAREGTARLHSADARKALIREHPWFKMLCSKDGGVDRVRRFMSAPSMVDGVEVRVVEVTGEPGDAYLMHPWMLHNLSPNCAPTPRIQLNTTVYRSGVLATYFHPGDRTAPVMPEA